MPGTQTIYIDVLLGLNLFVNYFLLLAVARFLGLRAGRLRLLGGAGLGALYSLAILLPPLPAALSLLVKLAVSGIIVLAAFPLAGWKLFLRALAAFYLVSFAFAGFLLVFWYLVSPQGLVIKNSVVYLDISPLVFLAATVLAYGAVRLFQRATGREAPRSLTCRVTAVKNGKTAVFTARVDTGNSLTEPFSGTPVIVAEESAAGGLAPAWGEGCRLVPFRTVSGSGLLQAFRPDRLTIQCGGRVTEPGEAYIALSKEPVSAGEFSALLNPALLEQP